MIQLVNTAAMEIQAALLARSLYPASHPRITSREAEATALLKEILVKQADVTLFAVDDRVVFNDEILPSSASLSALFHALRLRGAERITFLRGLGDEEVGALLDALASDDKGGSGSLRSSAHVRVGFIGRSDSPVVEAPALQLGPALGDPSDSLKDVLATLAEDQTLQVDLLSCIVATVSRVVNHNVDAMLPLAPLKSHDEYTFVHTVNVAILATALAEALGFNTRTTHDISVAAMLHDVGKQLVPSEVLNKSGKFTDEEFRLVQMHPVEGARILFNTPNVPAVAPIVAYEHHVRADGTGYPSVPPAWRPNLASRIVQVADVFDALRTHRPYRKALPVPKIVDIMSADAGPFFDGELLDVFFKSVVSRGVPAAETVAD